jgi:hypothetical protein
VLESIVNLDPVAVSWIPIKRGLLHTNSYIIQGLEIFFGIREWPENWS